MTGSPHEGPRFGHDELEDAVAAADVGVWTWAIGTGRMRASAEAARLFGLAAAPFEGTGEAFGSRIHPDDRAMVDAAIERALAARDQAYQLDHRVIVDGDVRWVQCRGRVVVDAAGAPVGMTGAVIDVTDSKVQSEQLRRSEELHRLVAELASDYVYVADPRAPQLAPTVVGGAFERTTSYTPEEVSAAGGWIELLHPDDRPDVDELTALLRAGLTFVKEYRIVRKDGEVRWLRDRVRPILDPVTGELVQLVGGVQDVTERRRLEEQLARAQKLEALARLAGSVAHDINNLLTVMMVVSSELDRDLPGTARAGATMQQVLERASELTRSLLTFARQQPAEPRVALLADAVARARPLLERGVGTGVALTIEDAGDGERVAIDQGQLEVALLNLAVNARDAMPDGGTLRITTGRRAFDALDPARPPELAAGTYAVIEVADTGVGMTADVQARLFEPFFTTKAPDKGTGLGLPAVHGVVAQLGGTIAVASAPEQGATFTIYLPLASGRLGAPVAWPAPHLVGGREAIALVDDDGAVRDAVTRVLDDLGYRVEAFDAAAALLADAAALERCALVIAGERVAGAPGIELAAEVVARRPGLRVLVIGDPADAARDAAGQVAFLARPFTRDGLARRIRALLDA